jgi:hypothetical protein
MNKTLFPIGLVIVGIDTALLLLNVIESGFSAMIAMIGIGLIVAPGRSKIKRI